MISGMLLIDAILRKHCFRLLRASMPLDWIRLTPAKMATTKLFMTGLLVLLIPRLNDNFVLGDDHDDCDSSEEYDLALALTDCETELYRCCQDRQSNGVSEPICAVIPCNGWRGVFKDRCNLIHFKCRYYTYHFKEYNKRHPGYWMNGCHYRSAYGMFSF